MSADMWKPYRMDVGQSLAWPIGDAIFHVRHTGSEWQVARQATDRPSGEIAWNRWTTGTEEPIVEPIPMMPDRSVIVRPEAPIRLAPGHTAVFYVSIPLWVQVTAGANRSLILADEPAVILSSIWFGEPTAGELCYSLRTRARREDTDHDAVQAHRAVCRVTINNQAKQPIPFQRLCLPARNLRTYAGESHLWTDDLTVGMASETVNRVRITGRPEGARGDAPAGPAREVMAGDHLLQRSFHTLRTMFG